MRPEAHVLLTRYNLPSAGAEAFIRARDDWLRHRTALFDRFTVPSVRAQTAPNVHWIVYLDPDSPRWLLHHMERLRLEGTLTPVLRRTVSSADVGSDIRDATGLKRGLVVTSNLDNDDGLANTFSERIQDAAAGATERTALYLATGLIRHDNRLFLRHDRQNAFCGVVEELENAATCWTDWHNRLHRHMRVLRVNGPPAWLQVVHGNNVSNRVRGRRVSPRPYEHSFPPKALADIESPGIHSVASDLLLGLPYRATRDFARSSIRSVAVRVAGKEGLDALKTRIGRLRV